MVGEQTGGSTAADRCHYCDAKAGEPHWMCPLSTGAELARHPRVTHYVGDDCPGGHVTLDDVALLEQAKMLCTRCGHERFKHKYLQRVIACQCSVEGGVCLCSWFEEVDGA